MLPGLRVSLLSCSRENQAATRKNFGYRSSQVETSHRPQPYYSCCYGGRNPLEDTDTATKREIALKCLILYMGEAVEDLKDFLVSEKEEAGQILQQETMAVFIIRDAQATHKHWHHS
ncbi:hypothetical protein R3I94_022160 [Phoxinus phoxinus]